MAVVAPSTAVALAVLFVISGLLLFYASNAQADRALEKLAGMDAAVGYLARLGRMLAGRSGLPEAHSLREDAHTAMTAIRSYEQVLSLETLRVLGRKVSWRRRITK